MHKLRNVTYENDYGDVLGKMGDKVVQTYVNPLKREDIWKSDSFITESSLHLRYKDQLVITV
jgi:hypothetical protein